MKCKNCKYWFEYEPNDDGYFPDIQHGHGICKCKKFIYDGEYDEEGSPTYPNDSLVYWDYEGYAANFQTGAEFGCIHFRNRNA